MVVEKNISIKQIWQILEQVTDPEIPVLSVVDLGIIRDILFIPPSLASNGIQNELAVHLIITPTYSGCPAIDAISMNIRLTLLQNGFENIKITQQLSPAWTTDWMTEDGKNKLRSYGIAAPVGKSIEIQDFENMKVECPQCHSLNTTILSQFGSTSCKALYQCNDCKEPFDYFKCH